MAASYLPIVMEKGSTFTLNLLYQSPQLQNIDITGCNAEMQVFQEPNYYTPVITLNSAGGGTAGTSLILGGTAGTINISMTPAVVARLTDNLRTVYGLILESPTGQFTRLFEGPVSLKRLLTQWS